MKKYLSTFLLIIAAVMISQAQTGALTAEQNNSISEIQKKNLQLVKLYNDKKFDDALVIGKDILEIAVKENLTADARVLPALRNLAEIYLAKGRESDAANVLKMASDSYEKMGDQGKIEKEKVLFRLASAYSNKKDFKNAEIQYLALKPLAEANHGEKSRQSADVYLQLANIYTLQNKTDDADVYYRKAILANDAVLVGVDDNKRDDVIQYRCFDYHVAFRKNNLKAGSDSFQEFNKTRDGFDLSFLNQGIVNGKAVKLVIPKYPERAREKRAGGFAIVNVEIDEQGNVTKAKAYCGFTDFVEAVEVAALKSKFSPTLKNGSPVKVTGDIVYIFAGPKNKN